MASAFRDVDNVPSGVWFHFLHNECAPDGSRVNKIPPTHRLDRKQISDHKQIWFRADDSRVLYTKYTVVRTFCAGGDSGLARGKHNPATKPFQHLYLSV